MLSHCRTIDSTAASATALTAAAFGVGRLLGSGDDFGPVASGLGDKADAGTVEAGWIGPPSTGAPLGGEDFPATGATGGGTALGDGAFAFGPTSEAGRRCGAFEFAGCAGAAPSLPAGLAAAAGTIGAAEGNDPAVGSPVGKLFPIRLPTSKPSSDRT